MKTFFGRTLLLSAILAALSVPALAQVTGWGASDNLQLLNANTTNASPIALTGLGAPVAVASGAQHAYALYADGTVSAWGNNGGNQLARPNNGPELPSTILGLPPVAKIFAGANAGYAITPTGTLWSWGFGGYGELGTGSTANATAPAVVGEVGPNAKVIGGDSRALLLKEDGTLYGAGFNYYWDLGLGDRGSRTTFTQITGLPSVKSAAFGGIRAAIASTADGHVYTWGASAYADTYTTPTLQDGLSGIVKVAATGGAAFAIDASGTLYSWGSNDNGRLGRTPSGDDLSPVAVSGLPAIADVSTSKDGAVYALGRDGSVWSWGAGAYGAIGDGFSVDRYAPVRVQGVSGISAISAGRGFVLAQAIPVQAVAAELAAFTLAESSTKGYRNVRGKITLDAPAGPGGVRVSLASRAVGAILPHGLSNQGYNGLTLSDVPSPRTTLKKVWRIRNRTSSTHNYQMLVLGMPDVIRGSVPAGCDGYFVSNTLPGCLNITLLLDDTNHLSFDIAGNAQGPVPTNVFASVGLPSEVVVPAGATSVEFDVWANEVPVDSTIEIVATHGTVTKVTPLKIVLETARPQA